MTTTSATRTRSRSKPKAVKPAPEQPAAVVVLRYVADRDPLTAHVFQSGIPNRDVTDQDKLPDELLELAVATGTHERI